MARDLVRPRRVTSKTRVKELAETGTPAAQRGARAFQAFMDHDFNRPVLTAHGSLRFCAVQLHERSGECWLEIYLSATSRRPDFRVHNPPLLAQDARGGVVVNGQRYRHDPVAALAELVLSYRTGRGKKR